MKPGWYVRMLFFLLLFCGSTSLFGQGALLLTGTIRHAQTKAPLESITVLKTATGRGTISNAAGIFRLMVQPGDTLLIRAVGFQSQRYVVHPRAQQELTIEILLEEGSVALPEVKVVGGLDYEKVNRALRNMKKPPPPKVVVKKPPPPKPLYKEKEAVPVAPTLENPASLIYDALSKEGKDRRKLEEILAEEAAKKNAVEEKKKQETYDSLFLNRNRDIRRR